MLGLKLSYVDKRGSLQYETFKTNRKVIVSNWIYDKSVFLKQKRRVVIPYHVSSVHVHGSFLPIIHVIKQPMIESRLFLAPFGNGSVGGCVKIFSANTTLARPCAKNLDPYTFVNIVTM